MTNAVQTIKSTYSKALKQIYHSNALLRKRKEKDTLPNDQLNVL